MCLSQFGSGKASVARAMHSLAHSAPEACSSAALRIELFVRTPPTPRESFVRRGIQIHTELGSSALVVRCAYETCV
jgi:hypothetical protein